jgi:hypothetical protein
MNRLLILFALIMPLSVACTAVSSQPEAALPPAVAVEATLAETLAAPTAEIPAPTHIPATPTLTVEPTKVVADLPNLGPAPEWSNDTWINSDPLTLADLRGKVVLLEFWTFG